VRDRYRGGDWAGRHIPFSQHVFVVLQSYNMSKANSGKVRLLESVLMSRSTIRGERTVKESIKREQGSKVYILQPSVQVQSTDAERMGSLPISGHIV